MEYRSADWYSLAEHERECMEFTADICTVHGTERTPQRGGDPVCTDCYLEELEGMRAPKNLNFRIIGKEPVHGREWIIEPINQEGN